MKKFKPFLVWQSRSQIDTKRDTKNKQFLSKGKQKLKQRFQTKSQRDNKRIYKMKWLKTFVNICYHPNKSRKVI